MDQIANLVIDLGIDAAEFKNEIPRIKVSVQRGPY